MSHTVPETLVCVFVEDYAYIRNLSITGNSGLLVESTF